MYHKALSFFLEIEKIKPEDITTLYNIADCYFYSGDDLNARRYYQKGTIFATLFMPIL